MPDLSDILDPFLSQLCGQVVPVLILAVLIGLATGLLFRSADHSLMRFVQRLLGIAPKKGRRHACRRGQGAGKN